MILLAFDLFVTQKYSSSDFLNVISDIYKKNIPKNKKLFLGIICDLGRIQTCNLLSRNQMRYSVAPRGLLRRQIYLILPSLQNYKARIVT